MVVNMCCFVLVSFYLVFFSVRNTNVCFCVQFCTQTSGQETPAAKDSVTSKAQDEDRSLKSVIIRQKSRPFKPAIVSPNLMNSLICQNCYYLWRVGKKKIKKKSGILKNSLEATGAFSSCIELLLSKLCSVDRTNL